MHALHFFSNKKKSVKYHSSGGAKKKRDINHVDHRSPRRSWSSIQIDLLSWPVSDRLPGVI